MAGAPTLALLLLGQLLAVTVMTKAQVSTGPQASWARTGGRRAAGWGGGHDSDVRP